MNVKNAASDMSASEFLSQALKLDRSGHEQKAIPLYRQAIARGLSTSDLHTALICLGSSLRAVGQIQASIRTLQKARKLFPRDVTVILFLALAHHSAGQHDLALRQLGDALINESKDDKLGEFREVLKRKYHAVRGNRRRS
jgi:tetratricopeptide (TPR) repeat protein